MTRRTFFGLSGATLVPWQLAAREGGFPGTVYRDYSRCLPDYLRELAGRAYQMRNREIAKLTSAEAIHTRQRWVRETFWKLAGGMPERTPLNARTVGSFERQGYRVEKIVYESRPDFHIPANLYIPADASSGRLPGVLFQMGHSANGKAYASYQRCCQGLVKLGFVVLAFDPVGQGERIYYPGSDPTRSRLGSADDEHTVPGRQMLLNGDSMARMQVWDAVRSLDYLASHPLVDPHRIASTGQSGGATLTMLLACVDERLAAAAVMSGNTENIACADFNPPGSTDDAEQDFVGSCPLGFDRWDLMYPMAPKPLLVSVSDKDWFGTYSPSYISNGWEEFGKLKRVYAALGHSDRVAWVDTPLPHSLAYDSRLQVYNWLLRWLKNDAKPVDREPPTAPEDDATLRVGESGNTVVSFGSLTPFAINRQRPQGKEPADLAALFGVDHPPSATRFAVLGRVPSQTVDIEAVEVPSAPRVALPAWFFLPRERNQSRPAWLILDENRNGRWHEGELYQELAATGCPVCVPSLRGLGDLRPEYGRGAAGYTRDHNNDENYAWASLILGKPLLGQRVSDILALTAALRSRPELNGRRLFVAAAGLLATPALVATALDKRIDGAFLAASLVSFRSIVDKEDYSVSLANFIPGVLRHTDLPEIAASIAPRKLILAGVVDAAGAAVDLDTARRLYPQAEVIAGGRVDLAALKQIS